MKSVFLCIAFTLLFLVAGCGSTRVVATPPRIVTPPSDLLEDCYQTPFTKLETNSQILISFQTLYLDFKECNLRKKALREWYQKVTAPEEAK